MWNCFKTTITKAVKDHIPHKTAKTKDGHPWVTMETKRLIRKRDRLYKKSKKSGNASLAKKYKEVKHQVQKSIRKSYWEYIESIILPPQDETNFGTMKKFWTYIKHKKTDYSGITEIKQDGKLLTDPLQKAGALNAQFQSVFTPASNISHTEFVKQCNMPQNTPFPPISKLIIKTEGIQKLLHNLNPNKAAGPDEIKPRFLKELSHEIAPILTIIFEKSIKTGVVPDD